MAWRETGCAVTAHLAGGEQPQPGLVLCGPWHPQVTRKDLGEHLPCVVQQL